MATIIVTNDDFILTITDDDGEVKVYENDELSNEWKVMLDDMVENSPPFAGTFYPEPGTMLGYYLLIAETPFGDLFNSIMVDGDIGEIPFDENVIY